jgi:hypothetical protein
MVFGEPRPSRRQRSVAATYRGRDARGANMTESARRALMGLRDFTTLQWYVVTLLALLFY